MIKTQAIVISTMKFQETSLIVKCYTQENGIVTYLLKGILKSSKKGLNNSLFQPLTQLEIVSTNQYKGHFQYINEAKVSYHYQHLHTNMMKNSVAFFIAEICYLVLKEETKDEALFHFLQQMLQKYDQEENFYNFHLKFLIDLTKFLGFFPDIRSLKYLFFDAEAGNFINEHNGHFLFSAEYSEIFKIFLVSSWEEIALLKLNRLERNQLLEYLLKYYTLHLPNFRKPKSWEILREIIA